MRPQIEKRLRKWTNQNDYRWNRFSKIVLFVCSLVQTQPQSQPPTTNHHQNRPTNRTNRTPKCPPRIASTKFCMRVILSFDRASRRHPSVWYGRQKPNCHIIGLCFTRCSYALNHRPAIIVDTFCYFMCVFSFCINCVWCFFVVEGPFSFWVENNMWGPPS